MGCQASEVIPVSAKTGEGVEKILEAIVERIPSPSGDKNKPLQALVFDSVYNPFRGIETYFRIINGSIKKHQKIKFVATNKTYIADEVGTLNLKQTQKPEIFAGDVGYLITGIKDAKEVKVGDLIEIKYLEKSDKFKVLQIPVTKSTPKSKMAEFVEQV